MSADWVRSIGAYFDMAASGYASSIEPAFAPLAAALVDTAEIRPGELVLDLGTGTGLAAHYAAQAGGVVTGVDIALLMLLSAAGGGPISRIQADMHDLPFREEAFDVVLAAFAFNSSDPVRALREGFRVMRPGARLLVHEWDTADSLSELVSDTFAEYVIEDPSPELEAFRRQMEESIPWDDLESVEGFAALLAEAGYRDIELAHQVVPVHLAGVDAFLRYKLAWPIRSAELTAMTAETRALCLSDLRENLAPYADAEGRITWMPNLVRVRAWK